MSRQIRPILRAVCSLAWLAVLAVPLVSPLAAATVPIEGPDSTPAPSLVVSGFVVASYMYSSKTVDSTTNLVVGRLFDRYSNAFMVNAARLTLDRAFVASKLDAGAHVDLTFGQDAEVIHSTGPFALGPNGDIQQAYFVLNMPTKNGKGVQIKFGKMVTLMGLEVIDTPLQPNFSEGNLFNFVENFTATGIELDFKPSNVVDVELRIDNGWDRVVVNDGQKSFMGRIGFASGNTSLGLLGYWGNMEAETSDAARMGAEALLNQKFGKSSFWVQADWGTEKANAALPDPTQDAKWWGVSGWLATDASPALNVALRADYVDDTNGFRTSGVLGFPASDGSAQKIWSLTGTLNIKAFKGALVRPEVRYDHSNLMVFDGETSQVSAGISAVYLF
ncbi:MAG TPA: outer membrane beta-barrel protein [Gemmatimonadales bacterium]|nr:outer membrane beta-barrel protein [Gemmatimonadales bacterium]